MWHARKPALRNEDKAGGERSVPKFRRADVIERERVTLMCAKRMAILSKSAKSMLKAKVVYEA